MKEKFIKFLDDCHILKVFLFIVLFSLLCCGTDLLFGIHTINGDFVFSMLIGIFVGISLEKDARKK